MRLEDRQEVLGAIANNPGLRLGKTGVRSIPRSILLSWRQARFSAKLVNVKTGSIDWVGEYTVESPAVLDDGEVVISLRRTAANVKSVADAMDAYNSRVANLETRARDAKAALDNALREGKSKVIERVEPPCRRAIADYNTARMQIPSALTEGWVYDYEIGAPVLKPDLLKENKTDEERRELAEHDKALCSRVTRDLLNTIRVK
jgi:hypothetical protein